MNQFYGWARALDQVVSTSGVTSGPAVPGIYPGTFVVVYLSGTTTPAPIYASQSAYDVKNNPFLTDVNGGFQFFGPNASYDLLFTLTPTSVAPVVSVPGGGTGLSTYAIGDLLYAASATVLSKLAAVAIGAVLVSGGVGAAPAWSAAPTVTTLTLTRLLSSTGNRLLHTTGTASVYLGVDAGNLTVSGTGKNSVMGASAGVALTTGYSDTLTGWLAGTNLTTGYGNTMTGSAAGYTSQDGYYNCFYGISAGGVTTTGYQNCFFGAFTGGTNTTGWNNTFLGDSAGRLNTIGISNTFLGRAAGDSNTEGNYGVFAGHQAGFRNTTGSFNTFLGDTAAMWNLTGARNVAVGNYALSTTVGANGNVSGDDNTCLGYNTGPSAVTQFSLSTAIGAHAQYGASNALILGGAGATNYVFIGVGLTSPAYKLDVVGQTFQFGADGSLPDVLRTNATNKTMRFVLPHYTTVEEPVFVIGASATSTANMVQIGGSASFANTATRISFYTAADNTTVTGTERWAIDENGWLVSQSANYDIRGFRHAVSSGYWEGAEMAAPAAPAANGGRLFWQDNGSGKTQLMAIFATGAAQVVATQP